MFGPLTPYLSRAVRRSLKGFYFSPKAPKAVRKDAGDNLPSSRAFSSSHDYNHFVWKDSKGTRFTQIQIVNALRSGERESASKMLFNLGHVNSSLSAEDFSYILEYCALTPDPLFVMQTWKIMEERAINITKKSCRSIIQALSKGGYPKEANKWLTFLVENDHVHAVLPMFNILLNGCGKAPNLTDADFCLELMEDRLIGKSEITYWELLKLAVMRKNLSAVHEIWKDCSRHYIPSIIMLRKFIWSFTRLDDLESANTVLQHMVALSKHGSASIKMSGKGRYQSSRLDIPIPAVNELSGVSPLLDDKCSLQLLSEESSLITENSLDEVSVGISSQKKQPVYNNTENLKLEMAWENLSDVPETAGPLSSEILESRFSYELKQESIEFSNSKMKQREMPSLPVMNLLRWSFNDIIQASARSNNCKLAEHLFLKMLDLGLEPSQHTYDGFVKAVVSGKGVDYGTKVIRSMEKRNIEPYNDTLAALSISHSKDLELDLAEALLEKISHNLPKYIHPFNALLAACRVMDEPERAVRVLAKIKHLNIKSHIRTYELMFSLFGTVNVPYEKGNLLSHVDVAKRINMIEMDMVKLGIRHSYASMTNLIRALGAEGMIQEMLRYLNVAENMLWQIDSYKRTDMYNIVLHALVKAKESHTAIEVFKNMRLCGLPANVATYNIMIECCSLLPCFKSACALVSIMFRDGFYPQTLTYTSLIKVLLAKDDFETALLLLDQSGSEEIAPDIQLFNTILREAYPKGRIDVVEQIIEHIHREKIQPDPSTLWYTFSAYVECGFHNTAIEALQVLSMRMISVEDSMLQEKRAAYDDLIHSEDLDAETQIIEAFKESEEFLATGLLNLRWCAIIGSSVSWSPENSLWSKRLSSSYAAGNVSA